MTRDERPVGELSGIGPKMSLWLNAIGLMTVADLQAIGAVDVYRRLKASRPRDVSLNALYGLEAALLGIRLADLTPDMKAHLKFQLEPDDRDHPAL